MQIADKIVQLRKGKGWSQEYLAEKLGVSLNLYLNGKVEHAMPEVNRIVGSGSFRVIYRLFIKG